MVSKKPESKSSENNYRLPHIKGRTYAYRSSEDPDVNRLQEYKEMRSYVKHHFCGDMRMHDASIVQLLD